MAKCDLGVGPFNVRRGMVLLIQQNSTYLDAGYPDRLGLSGKSVATSTKLTCLCPLSDQVQYSVMASRTSNQAWSGSLDAGTYCKCGPGSVVGIATGYGLDGPGIEFRRGARFSAPVQTGPGAHLASCTMSTGSFPGEKSSRGVTLTPHPILLPWS